MKDEICAELHAQIAHSVRMMFDHLADNVKTLVNRHHSLADQPTTDPVADTKASDFDNSSTIDNEFEIVSCAMSPHSEISLENEPEPLQHSEKLEIDGDSTDECEEYRTKISQLEREKNELSLKLKDAEKLIDCSESIAAEMQLLSDETVAQLASYKQQFVNFGALTVQVNLKIKM